MRADRSRPPTSDIRVTIRDILLPLELVAPDAWVPGRVVPRQRIVERACKPTIVADLHTDADGDIVVNSKVEYNGMRPYYVEELNGGRATLFHDVRVGATRAFDVDVRELTLLPQVIPLLDVDGVASAFTRFGVGHAGNRKQLWLRDGKAYRPHGRELMRLHELGDVVAAAHVVANAGCERAPLAEVAGDGVSMRMSDARAARATMRPTG